MPVYRKGKKYQKEINEATIKRIKGKRVIVKEERWGITATPLRDIYMDFTCNIKGKKVFDFKEEIKKISEKVKNPVIVDWGCGKGTAITELAYNFKNAKCYGFSKEYYAKWEDNIESGVKFIHATAEDFKRYFKNNSIDVLYSYVGLYHLPKQQIIDYIKEIIPKIKKNGFIIFNYSAKKIEEIMHSLKIEGTKIEVWDKNSYLPLDSGFHKIILIRKIKD